MIVKCASCQTRFKIGDDKVTDKGVKVRCTKCGTVFTVRKGDSGDGPAAPEPPPRPAPSAGSGRPSAIASTPLSDLLGADLVAKPVLSPTVASPAVAPMDDPFAAFMGNAAPAAAPAPANGPGLMPGEFALSGGAPQAGAAFPHASTSAEDLLGLGASWPATPSALAATAAPPSPFDAALDPLGGALAVPPSMPADPFGALPPDPFGDLPTTPVGSTHPPRPPPTVASFGAEFDSGTFDPLAGLSLDPGALSSEPAAEALPPSSGGDSPSDLFDLPPKPVAPPPSPGSSPPMPAASPSSNSSTAIARIAVVKGEAARQADVQREIVEDRPLAARVFSALTVAATVAMLVLGFVAWRNGGRLDLRDPLSAIFNAFGFSRPVPPSLSLPTEIAGSGFYATLRGDPVLFVRGSVKNLTPAAAQVGLKLDVIVDGHTLVTAEGVPGVLPTPEDLSGLNGPADLKALRDRLASTPPAPIPPGQSADFLLVTADLHDGNRAGLDHAELVVAASPLRPTSAQPAAPRSGVVPAPPAAPLPPKAAAATPPPPVAPTPGSATAAQTPVPSPTH